MANGLSGLLSGISGALTAPSRGVLNDINGSDEGDMALVQQILAGLNAPEKKPGIAETILPAIAQALSVAFAQDPAGALADQLKNRQVLQEREKERKERIKQLGAQLQIEDILSRGKERRAEAATVRGEARADRRAITDYLRNSGFQLRKIDIENKNAKDLLDIQQGFQDEQRGKRFVDDKALLDAKSSADNLSRRIAMETEFSLPLIYSKFFQGDEAAKIYDKIATKGLSSLTADESKKITKARDALSDEDFKRRLSLVHAQNSGTSESLGAQVTKMAIQRASATTLGVDAQGNVRELIQSQLPGEGMVLPDGNAPARILTEPEETKYFIDQFSRLTPGVFGGGLTSTDINQDQGASLKLDQIIQTARNVEKLSDAQIIQNLNDPTVRANLGITPQQVQDAVTRNKLGTTTIPPADLEKQLSDLELKAGVKGGELEEQRKKLQSQIESSKASAKAANIIMNLVDDLRDARKLREQVIREGSSGEESRITKKIKDLESRLRVAISKHPELDPFK